VDKWTSFHPNNPVNPDSEKKDYKIQGTWYKDLFVAPLDVASFDTSKLKNKRPRLQAKQEFCF
jgi:hypothetical protein